MNKESHDQKLSTCLQNIKSELESKQVQCNQSDEERRSLERRLDEVSRKTMSLLYTVFHLVIPARRGKAEF